MHRRLGIRARGWGLQPPKWGKAIISRASTKFFWQRPAAKNEKEKVFLYLLNEKERNSFLLARKSTGNPAFLLIFIEWGETGKVIMQVSIAVFQMLSKYFSAKDGWTLPLEKIGPYSYGVMSREHSGVTLWSLSDANDNDDDDDDSSKHTESDFFVFYTDKFRYRLRYFSLLLYVIHRVKWWWLLLTRV